MLSEGQKQIVEKYMQQWRRGIISKLDNNQRPNPSTLTGASARDITFSVNNNGAVLYGPSYIANLEFGRKPGKMPPVGPLIEWARLRGFEDPESAGWAIAIKIRDEGTELNRTGKASGVISDVITPESVNKLADELADITLEEISTLLFDQITK